MDEETRLDIGVARLVHLNWAFSLEALAANPRAELKIPSDRECELGHWIYTAGFQAYGDFDATRLLMDAHLRFHQVAQEIEADPLRGELLPLALEEIRTLSRDVIYYLTELELDILGQKRQKQLLTHPVQSLIDRLFHGPHQNLPESCGPLNVNHVRLIHLNWTRDLTKSFRAWGRDAQLESANSCVVGAWLRTTGVVLRKKYTEIDILHAVHGEFHEQVEKTIRSLQHKRENVAEESYTKTLELSRTLIYILSIIEFKLLAAGEVAIGAEPSD